MVKPSTLMIANEPTIETGIASSGISVARQSRRKTKIITITRIDASHSVRFTSLTERSTNTLLSEEISTRTPSGRSPWMKGICAFTPFATSSRLERDCRSTDRLTVGRPLK